MCNPREVSLQNVRMRTPTVLFVGVSTILSLPGNVEEKYKEIGGLPELDGRYTVLGQVYEGMDVVKKIAEQETDDDDAPVSDPVKIKKITFEKVE